MIRDATRARIEAAHRFSAFYRGYLANHLPMALVALDRMGADDAALARFAGRYEAQLEPLAGHPVFARSAAVLEERIANEGAHAVLRAQIERLATGVASGAFHGAIRTAYAIESGLDRELAHALAYWNIEFTAFAEPAECTGTESPAEVLAAIARDPRFARRRFPGRNIAERTKNAVDDPALASLVARADPDKLTLETIAAALIRAYGASGDFTLLHGVTGCHAFRLLVPFMQDARLGVSHLWQALVAAYLGAGSPAVEGWGVQGRDALGWDEILQRAAECDDEHDVKFAYTCWREGSHYGDDFHRRAASSRVCQALRETLAC